MIEISRTRLFPSDNRRMNGFTDLNPRTGCSKIFLSLQSIGLSSVVDEKQDFSNTPLKDAFVPTVFKYDYYTGKVLLDMRGSGIRERIFINRAVWKDRGIPEYYRKSFKTDVYGELKAAIPDGEEYFRLLLHYNMGALVGLQYENRTKKK
jgi:hypothetical protein